VPTTVEESSPVQRPMMLCPPGYRPTPAYGMRYYQPPWCQPYPYYQPPMYPPPGYQPYPAMHPPAAVHGPIPIAGIGTPPPPYGGLSPPPPPAPYAPIAEKGEKSDGDGGKKGEDDEGKKAEAKNEAESKGEKKAVEKGNAYAPPKLGKGANYMFDPQSTWIHVFNKAAPVWTQKYRNEQLYDHPNFAYWFFILTIPAGGSRCSKSA
jgi:hypothetical protein